MLRITFISDTHCHHDELKLTEGDILIHSGDATFSGTTKEIISFNNWLGEQPFRHKIFIAGNHDLMFEKQPSYARSLLTNAIYLQDTMVELEGIKIWGSPYTPNFYDWAFMCERGKDMKKHWDLIPANLDILVTHGPPHKILDSINGEHAGCEELWKRLKELSKGGRSPRIHAFGHIHEGRGVYEGLFTRYLNASVLNGAYQLANKPINIKYDEYYHILEAESVRGIASNSL